MFNQHEILNFPQDSEKIHVCQEIGIWGVHITFYSLERKSIFSFVLRIFILFLMEIAHVVII